MTPGSSFSTVGWIPSGHVDLHASIWSSKSCTSLELGGGLSFPQAQSCSSELQGSQDHRCCVSAVCCSYLTSAGPRSPMRIRAADLQESLSSLQNNSSESPSWLGAYGRLWLTTLPVPAEELKFSSFSFQGYAWCPSTCRKRCEASGISLFSP